MKTTLLCFLLLLQLSAAAQADQFLIPFRQNNKWGFSDTLGNVKVKPAYDSAAFLMVTGFLQRGLGKIFSPKGEGIIAFSGKVVVPPVYDTVDKLVHYYRVKKGKRLGLYDSTGWVAVPMQYDDIYPADYQQGYFGLLLNGKTGLYHATTKKTIPAIYDKITPFFSAKDVQAGEWFFAKKGKQQFLIRKADAEMVMYNGELQDESVPPESVPLEEVLSAESKSQNILEQVKTKFGADKVKPFEGASVFSDISDQLYLIEKNGKKGLVSQKAIFLAPQYDSVTYAMRLWKQDYVKIPSEYLFAVKKGLHFGIINEKGEEILPFQYDLITELEGYEKDFELTVAGKKGAYFPYARHTFISPKYDAISFGQELSEYIKWRFVLYKVVLNKRSGYVGENSVEYFK